MADFTFVQQVKVITGRGSFSKIGSLIAECGYQKVFIVTTSGMVRRGTIGKLQEQLQAQSIASVVYDAVTPDPSAELIDAGADLCKTNACDCVLAIGGGSCLDAAKGINILRFNDGKILDYTTKPIQICHNLIVVPTTSGTGSELSNGTIVSDTKNHVKLPIGCADCMPEYAILDPELTVSMPKKVTIDTGLDVFSHAFEAYTAVTSNPMTDVICEAVMETVVQYLPLACAHPDDLDAREKMQSAAAIAGWMLYNCAAHVGHSYAHVIGAHFQIAHGEACACGLPSVVKVIAGAVPAKIKRVGQILGVCFTGDESAAEIAQKTANAYQAFVHELGLAIHLPEICDAEADQLAEMIVQEAFAGLAPVKITKECAMTLVTDSLK